MSWISGPCNDEPRRDDDEDEPRPLLEDTGTHWVRKMAKSESHWTSINWEHFDQSRGPVEED